MLIRSPRDAEEAACAWMRDNGYPNARLTPRGPDRGVDVRSSLAVAQVKAETSPVGVEAIQRLLGIANVARVGSASLHQTQGQHSGLGEW